MTKGQAKIGFGRKVRALFSNFFGAVGLWVFPYPIFLFKRALAGRENASGDLEFYCHPRFAITSHIIFVGWLVSLGTLLNATVFGDAGIPAQALSWPWLLAIGFTLTAMGRDWEIISSIMVGGTILLVTAVLVILELTGDWELFKPVYEIIKQVPVRMEWGGPFLLSLVLGFFYVLMASYQRVDDVWRLPSHGNLLDHYRFERSDTSISKGGKTFRADWPCMLKKWFFFGYGNILILDAHSKRTLHRIEGVFFARQHAEVLKVRFATTDATLVEHELASEAAMAEDEDEIAADDDL
ncbi:MAG: hypothetical protein KDC38_04095 [Planctomycetes bacterium]|nr:hypothetical protein [Planctomycetota bacterium]